MLTNKNKINTTIATTYFSSMTIRKVTTYFYKDAVYDF